MKKRPDAAQNHRANPQFWAFLTRTREIHAGSKYYGTFWGDRPSIRRTLDMVRTGDYSFDAPERLKPTTGP